MARGVLAWWATNVDELTPLLGAWRALSATLGRPMSAPEWLLPWWEERPNPRWRLRVLVVEENDRLAALFPLYARGWPSQMRLLGQPVGLWNCGPLVDPASSPEVLRRIAAELAAAKAGLLSLDALDAEGVATIVRVAGLWPTRGVGVVVGARADAAVVRIEGTFDEWVSSRGANWRQAYRRYHRQLKDAGGAIRGAASPREFSADFETLVALHSLRWKGRSGWLTPHLERTLRAVTRSIAGSGAIRIHTAEIQGQPVFSTLSAALGGGAVSVVGGFDQRHEAFNRLSPGILCHVASIEAAFDRGDTVMDFGYGTMGYKSRFVEQPSTVEWHELSPRGSRSTLVRARNMLVAGARRARARVWSTRRGRACSTET